MKTYQSRLDKISYWESYQQDLVDSHVMEIQVLEDSLYLQQKASELCAMCIQDSVNAKEFIEDLVSLFLKYLFGEEFSFYFLVIKDSKTQQVTGLKPIIVEGDKHEDADGCGDGIKNCAAFGLRLAFLILNSDKEQVIIADELFTNLAENMWEAVVRFLEDYTKDNDFQFIVITHVNCKFPKTLYVTKKNGISLVEEV